MIGAFYQIWKYLTPVIYTAKILRFHGTHIEVEPTVVHASEGELEMLLLNPFSILNIS